MSDAWPVPTPVCPGAEAPNAAMAPSTSAEAAEMARKPFRELIGAVLYLAVTIRPDIFDAVRTLSRFCNNPGHTHWLAALWLLRFLKGTVKKGLLYSRSAAIGAAVPGAAIGFADADWARDIDKRRRSIGAYIFLRSGAAISWRSKMHAGLRRWLDLGLRLPVTAATPIHEDNKPARDVAANPFSERRVKHIDIKFHIVRERVESGEVCMVPVKTEDQLADLLTKPLPA
ncbi:unnamed protein product, partial [Phaeothamnion confervicola]